MGCGESCSKFFLFVVNIIVWIVGAVLLALGIWVAVSPVTFVQNALNVVNVASNNNQQVTALTNYFLTNNSLLLIGAYIIIAIGGFLFLVGFCGCCGACRSSKFLLMLYIIFCVISFVLTLVAGILEAVYLNQVSSVMTSGYTSLQQTNFDGIWASGNPLSLMWYSIMQGKQCCGVNGQSDFTTNRAAMATLWSNNGCNTSAANNVYYSGAMLPASCCPQNTTYIYPGCATSGAGAYNQSCQAVFITPFAAQIQQYATILMGVTFGLSAFCLLAIVAAATMMHEHGMNEK